MKLSNKNWIIKNACARHKLERFLQLLLGVFLLAVGFNLFFYPRKIVYGGMSGLSIVIDSMFHIPPALFIFTTDLILLIISFLVLGKEKTYKSIFVVFVFPFFLTLTANITHLIYLNNADTLLMAIFGAVISGIGNGLIFKTGFNSGGTDIISEILVKYKKISVGSAMITINSIIIFIGALASGWVTALYAIIVLYIISVITDRVILGISESKAFYIVTEKDEEVKHYILKNLSEGITIFDAVGGYTNKATKVLMCVIPTKEYFRLKEGIHHIDKDAFFVVTDAYEVYGGDRI